MGRPRVQFTMRRMMALIAVVGLILGAAVGFWRLKTLRDGYRHQAERQAQIEQLIGEQRQSFVESLEIIKGNVDRHRRHLRIQLGPARTTVLPSVEESERGIKQGLEVEAEVRAYLTSLDQRVGYHTRLRLKYEAATKRPWLPIEPDGQPPRLPELPSKQLIH